MEILESLEVRWFLQDREPSADRWRHVFAPVASEGQRVDQYLITGRDDLGFKARVAEGQPAKVETKYLLGSLGTVQVAPGLIGTIERWKKLSLTLDDGELRKQGQWLSLKKARRLRKYAYENGLATEVLVSERPQVGCGVELTELTYSHRGQEGTACTVGLEAFGPPHLLLGVLLASCRMAVGTHTALEGRSEHSLSYPAWLSQLALSLP